jgi:hypothetical protein
VTSNRPHLGSTRVLAVILTHNRPEELERCIHTAFSTMGSEDLLAVLDDSSPKVSSANATLLAKAASRSIVRFCHIHADRLHEDVARTLRGKMAQWQLRTARRDIAPLRNLSLLISDAVRPQTTVLMDDDICGFDLNRTHRMCDDLGSTGDGLITGATIGGLSDLDTVTRLSNAMHFLAINARDIPITIADLFQVTPSDDGGARDSGCVSAGYMAFRLPPKRLFAFPPGYNEDWLWCLLHKASGDIRILRTEQVVLHKPPQLRGPTREDILFEMSGDIIFDCIAERINGRRSMPESTLRNLPELPPNSSTLPSPRVEAILAQFRELPNNPHGGALTNLGDHGLTLLQDLLAAGELEVDGTTMLSTWSTDAVAKHRSFATTIGTPIVQSTVRQALSEGRR